MEAFGFGTTEEEMDEHMMEQEVLAQDLGIEFSDMEAEEDQQ